MTEFHQTIEGHGKGLAWNDGSLLILSPTYTKTSVYIRKETNCDASVQIQRDISMVGAAAIALSTYN